MHAREVVVHVEQRNMVMWLSSFLLKRIRQASEPAHFIRMLRFWRST